MITFPNGNKYRLIYLDTNAISDISKNTKNLGKNFLLNYHDGMFVTSVFNLFELSKTKGTSREKVISFFDVMPLAICVTFPQLIEFEKFSQIFHNDMIMFAIGNKELFSTQLSVIFDGLETSSFQQTFIDMNDNFSKDLEQWKSQKVHSDWQKSFDKNLLSAMNDNFKLASNHFHINELGKYLSLEVLTYIRNQFLTNKPKELNTNSIIDSINSSFLPYCDVYVTERIVGSWLTMAKNKFPYLADKKIIKLSELFD